MGRKKAWLPWAAFKMMCEGKKQFESYKLATDVAKRSRHRHTEKISAYKCPACGFWHIGRSNGGKWNKRAKGRK